MGAYPLHPGAIADADYLSKTGALEEQAKFQKKDGEQPFINAVDRGYRSAKAASKQGQFVLQLFFSKSDRKFNIKETLQSSSVAADRSGD